MNEVKSPKKPMLYYYAMALLVLLLINFLAKRTERRKVLVVLSDGLPSGYFSEAEAIDDVRTAVQAARRRGLLVIPIIYTARTDENVDAYRRMYEKSMIFADSVGMLGEFERLLMKLVR